MKAYKLFVVLILAAAGLGAQDISLRARPFMYTPTGESSDLYDTGYGADLMADLDLSSIFGSFYGVGYTAGLEGGMAMSPLKGVGSENLRLSSAALGLGFYYYPFSRLSLRADAAYGLYKGVLGSQGSSSTWWRTGLEAGFRFTPAFTLSAAGGYRNYDNKYGGAMSTGFYIGLSAQLNIELGESSSGVAADLDQEEPVYPPLMAVYRETPAAMVNLVNRESAEIRNVRLFFRAENYTAGEFLCAAVSSMDKREVLSLPLFADFLPNALNLTENSRIAGELVVRYEILGKEKTAILPAAVQAHNRNAFNWIDPSALAAFVSPNTPETQEFAKQITGFARTRLKPGMNRALQFGMYLFEGISSSGIGYSPTVSTPYAKYRTNSGELDSVQFPFQTLAYKTGDIDDLGILYASLLEASGIHAAFIPLEDDFIVAFAPGIPAGSVGSNFNGESRILLVNDMVWIPLSFSAFDKGFSESWAAAVSALGRAFAAGKQADFVVLQEAWGSYPPANLPPQSLSPVRPVEAAMARGADEAVRRYINTELEPAIRALSGQASTAAQYNRLGILYMRSGANGQARANFERAAGMNYVSAMVNLGSLAFQEKDMAASDRWYRRALSVDPQNSLAKAGLERIATVRE